MRNTYLWNETQYVKKLKLHIILTHTTESAQNVLGSDGPSLQPEMVIRSERRRGSRRGFNTRLEELSVEKYPARQLARVPHQIGIVGHGERVGEEPGTGVEKGRERKLFGRSSIFAIAIRLGASLWRR